MASLVLVLVLACAGDPGPAVLADAGAGLADAGATPAARAGADAGAPVAGKGAAPVVGAASVASPPPGLGEPCILSSEASGARPGAAPDRLSLAAVSFRDLPGWADDRQAAAVPAFLGSCEVIGRLSDEAAVGVDGSGGRARDWRAACAAAAALPPGDDAAARGFFESEFAPWSAAGRGGRVGKLTGYHVQAMRGSRTRHGRFQVPIWGRPPDLVSVDLTAFLPDARGRRIWGRLDPKNGALVPYATRAAIRQGALAGKGLELLWVDDPVDALFADIQGSAVVALDDGTEVWIGFAGKNGCTYRGVGKVLKELGELGGYGGTIPGIRGWFADHPERFDEIADRNRSKVFFRIADRPGAVGSQGVVLTPGRSLAVDRAFVAASTPVWVDTRAPVAGARGTAPWRSLLIAQDTGGGILGPVRGDIYWGADQAAAERAGRTGGPGRVWLLLPRALRPASSRASATSRRRSSGGTRRGRRSPRTDRTGSSSPR
ncbi:MAG TPA: MltA domain-containing protein [Kofleriaceae bacterium]|nr:MltA domain-containing protein [Kofleriaceae bacterium]